MRNHATAVRRFSRLSRLSHAGALTFALASVLSVTPAWSEEARIWRAAITDPQAKTIRIWDLGEREEVASFKTTSPAQLHPGLNPMGLVSVESASGEVRLLNLGLKQEDHGDHTHWVTGKPSLSASVMQGKGQGQRPSHANTSATQLAVFFDGDGAIRVVSPNRPQSPLQERTTARAHHGIAVPLADGKLLVSQPAEEGTLPQGMQLLDATGKLLATSPRCGAQHGDGHYKTQYLFGCDNGLLLYNDQQQSFELLAYPADANTRIVRNMISTPQAPRFVASFGAEALLAVDLAQRTLIPMPLPSPLVHYGWDPEKPDEVFVLLRTGELLALDSRTGKLLRRAELLQAWAPAAPGSTNPFPAPRLAVSAGRVAVVDAREGLLHFVRTSDLKSLDQIALGGQPATLVMRSVNLDAH